MTRAKRDVTLRIGRQYLTQCLGWPAGRYPVTCGAQMLLYGVEGECSVREGTSFINSLKGMQTPEYKQY